MTSSSSFFVNPMNLFTSPPLSYFPSPRHNAAPVRRRQSVKDLPVTRPELLSILSDLHYGRYHIERYSGPNRLVEAVVAQFQLGASRERIHNFIEHYISLLFAVEPATRLKEEEETKTLDQLKGEHTFRSSIKYQICFSALLAPSRDNAKPWSFLLLLLWGKCR